MKKNSFKGINKKILIILILYFAVIGLLFTTVLNNIYFKSFEDLEKIDMEKNIDRVKNEIDYRRNKLNSDVSNWAILDGADLFDQGLNENYIEKNLTDETLDSLKVDIIMLSDDSGMMFYGKQKDFKTGNIKEIDKVVSEDFIQSGILENKDSEMVFNDILIIDGSPVLIGAHPILKGDQSGLVNGSLIFGRILSIDKINKTSEKLNLEVSFELIPKVVFDKLHFKNKQEIEIQTQNDDYIIGSFYVPKLSEEYYTKISVKTPRDIMEVGYNSAKILTVIMPLIFIGTLLTLWIVLDKLVLSRIVKLNNQVLKIKEEKSSSARVDIDKNDEISGLSRGINGMLDSLESLQDKVSNANKLLEEKVLERTRELQITNRKLEAEIIERKKIQEKVTFMAYHDALTGLPNRLLLNDRVNQGILYASRQKTLISIMFIDLDEFKKINDALGHNQGDELLRQVSKRLLSVVRKSDTVYRLGGDEFIIYINGYKNKEDLDIIASKTIDVLNKPFVLEGQEYFITGSIGISQYPKDGEDVETLIKNADKAMYESKSLGKNQYKKYCLEA